MPEPHHLDDGRRERWARRAWVVQMLRVEQHPTRLHVLVRQRRPVDGVVEIDRPVLGRDFGDQVTWKSLLQRLPEIPPRLRNKRHDTHRDYPGRHAPSFEKL